MSTKTRGCCIKEIFCTQKSCYFFRNGASYKLRFPRFKKLVSRLVFGQILFSQFFYFRGNIRNVKEKDFDFSSGPRLFYSSFWGVPTHADVIEFSNFLLRIKTQKRLAAKLCVAYYYFSFERNYDVLKSKGPRVEKNINFNRNETESKTENPTHSSRDMKQCASVRIKIAY